jgi:hypothetical protein
MVFLLFAIAGFADQSGVVKRKRQGVALPLLCF